MLNLKEMFLRVKDCFKPYTFEDYVAEYNPSSIQDVEYLEKQFDKVVTHFLIAPRF